MKIIVGKFSGFCIGVKKAIVKISNELDNNTETLIYGEVIHNPQTVSVLNDRGLKPIDNLDNIFGKIVAVRTHGIPFQEIKKINKKASKTINLTCSKVAKVQGTIKKYANNGYFTIIVGDKNHAEVKSLKSYAVNGYQIISNYEEVKLIKNRKKTILVCQTTIEESLFKKIEVFLKKKKYNFKIFNTICNSTHTRQCELISYIKKGITKAVVIGGKNSGNTKRLADIGVKNKVVTFHIEKCSELKKNMFNKNDVVFVTAGASTPSWIINNVLNRLNFIKYINNNLFIKSTFLFNYFINRAHIYSPFTGLIILAIIKNSFKMSINNYFYFLIPLLFMCLNLINILCENTVFKYRNFEKYETFNKFRCIVKMVLFSIIIAQLIVSYYINISITIITMFLTIIFLLIKKSFVNKIYNKRLKVLTIVSNFISPIFFSIFILLPFYKTMDIVLFISIFLNLFTLFFLQNSVIDIINFEGDIIIGNHTYFVNTGKRMGLNLIIIFSAIIFLTDILMIIQGMNVFIIFILMNIVLVILIKYLSLIDYLYEFKYEFLTNNFVIFISVLYIVLLKCGY